MTIHSSLSLFLLSFGTAALAGDKMTIGDGQIDGARLKPYKLTWQQCVLQGGQWQDQGALTEELTVIGAHVLRLRQVAGNEAAVNSRSDTYFDRVSFAPLRMEMEATKDGETMAQATRQIGPDGYSGFVLQGGSRKELGGKISSKMLHGAAMGLPLATINSPDGPLEFVASMVAFDATYDVIAEWVGKETLRFDGQDIDAWLVDVEWHHRESSEVYPPGPDASGGRFWLVPQPPDGFPYVPRYKTDTYAVEFVSGVCPTASD